MPQLLQLADIMEFAAAAAVPEDAIGDEALRNVAALDEREQIEPWLRTLLHSPDRTPHGPTEIADILTTHATVGGRRRFAAFIVKGRSTPRVASREIAHQILRLKQLPGLEVVALLAVGDIQDDAQRDFIGVAHDMGCDFVVAGRKDVARLFLGDGRLCPIDGLPFADGQCPDGHRQTPEIELRYPVRERPRWQLFSVSDNSHGWARRLSATIVVDPHYPQETIREVIRQATQQVRHDRFYGSDLLRERWEGQPAHVVWIFVAADVADVAACNWMCRACWIDPSLVPEHRPNWDATEDVYEGIAIVWNAHYHEMKEALGAAAGTKAEVMESVEAILLRALPLLSQ
ncbi:MAG: hypothetical protein KKI08_09760, partial [Armatimonadetes bacterium]|nr:hypothetical protein [Armatimonadota bacterium]